MLICLYINQCLAKVILLVCVVSKQTLQLCSLRNSKAIKLSSLVCIDKALNDVNLVIRIHLFDSICRCTSVCFPITKFDVNVFNDALSQILITCSNWHTVRHIYIYSEQ